LDEADVSRAETKGRYMRDRLPTPVDPRRRAVAERGRRPSPAFLERLIATAQHARQTRARGRVAPAVATMRYTATAHPVAAARRHDSSM